MTIIGTGGGDAPVRPNAGEPGDARAATVRRRFFVLTGGI